MAAIPKTQKKLREAKFFLGRMSEANKSPRLDREDFDFYLSAFLSAARSVTWFLRKENEKRYDVCSPASKMTLADKDRELLEFMITQRNAEVHTGGAQIQVSTEMVPVTQIRLNDRGHPTYGIQWSAPIGTPPPQIGQKVHYFEMGETKDEVVSTCKRYVTLLEKFVREFEEQSQGSNPDGT